MRTPVTVAVVSGRSGLGAKLARAFDELPQATLRWICDQPPRTASVGYGPATAWTSDFDELLQDEDLDVVVFASSELAGSGRGLAALAADKHVFIDGALASNSAEAKPASDGAFARPAAARRAPASPAHRPRRAR